MPEIEDLEVEVDARQHYEEVEEVAKVEPELLLLDTVFHAAIFRKMNFDTSTYYWFAIFHAEVLRLIMLKYVYAIVDVKSELNDLDHHVRPEEQKTHDFFVREL